MEMSGDTQLLLEFVNKIIRVEVLKLFDPMTLLLAVKYSLNCLGTCK